MKALQEYQKWLNYKELPKKLYQELLAIQGNTAAIEERFGGVLDFGTAGLRGILGPGLNRMNIYTIRRTSWALAQYILRQNDGKDLRSIVIGYDSRHMSREFAQEAGLTIAAAGIRAYVSPYLCPTPEVSFSVRHLQADAGIMITASHNPPEYNGFKVYDPHGYQLLPDAASKIHNIMLENQDVFKLSILSLDDATKRELFQWITPQIRNIYTKTIVNEVQFPSVTSSQRKDLSIVYTPLHGTGNIPVQEVLQASGYNKVHVVKEQADPDGDFPTVKSPNPEESEALKLGICLANKIQADIVMGTDPDADRVGIAVCNDKGAYQLLTGNQVGALLVEFILSQRKTENRLPNNGIIFSTIVSSTLGQAVASSYKIPIENTLTGFKYIGEGITRYEKESEHTFLFGYEESYGYLISPIVRDKDAVQTCLAIAEMTSFYKEQGKTLLVVLEELFQRFGYYKEELFTLPINGGNAPNQTELVMAELRKNIPKIEGLKLVSIDDYHTLKRTYINRKGESTSNTEPLLLPSSNVLKYWYEDGSWIAIRPSGTEPKLKVYLAAHGTGPTECETKIQQMQAAIKNHIK
ncbi:phospho-sugar mutase [Priestia megaterium]|uniref:phospho-sugar mutase n=1 Tax=Priestia megaterium TaxID=1404 RepID=UPI000BEE09B5|nr:phospho-sugar mutase [Priestia megaterium]MDP9580317.1 phosphoglucomutase [Bacillus sp. 1751]MED4067600.1 phospho-sugar mutase [Priestia megaterium]PEA35733.1 phosphoglucomutase [Priestia megaterium]PEE42268.1 phosphoglucomutase [Priestia megaterium]PFK47173.1 phosphoglucomutase [Priestia megaterium]